MKTLIINGSPRRNGDTKSLLNLITDGLAGEYKIIDAYRADISPCIDCRYCWKESGCAIKDEMQDVYEYIKHCDNILIAAPVYFSELPGKVLDVASRLQTYYCARAFRNEVPIEKIKRGAVVLVGGGDGRIDKAYSTAKTLLHHMNCKEIHELVSSHNTNNRPAIEDEEAVAGVNSVIRYFNHES